MDYILGSFLSVSPDMWMKTLTSEISVFKVDLFEFWNTAGY